jgi:hypothetical protein
VRTYIGERYLKVKHEFGNNLASLSRNPDPDPEAIEKALLDDPVGFMFAVWDAEDAEDAPTLGSSDAHDTAELRGVRKADVHDVEFWKRAIADFAARERVKIQPFKYASICSRPADHEREWDRLNAKPWLDFGRNWPYCFRYLLRHDAWLPLGREYQPLGEMQWGVTVGVHYDDFAHAAWRFVVDPHTLGIWRKAYPSTLYLYNDDPASRRDYFARVGRLIAATDDPIKYARRLTGRDLPPHDGASLMAAAVA